MGKADSDKINLLLIEDDSTQVILIEESLNPDKYEITNIQNGKEAFEYLAEVKEFPDLILLDYHLPYMDGLTIMSKLKELGKTPDFIFLTADYSIETALKSVSAGALEFIPKDGRFIKNIPDIINRAVINIRIKAEKERIQKALNESEERLKSVMEASRDGILERDIKTGKMSLNPNCSLMLGYWPNEISDNYNEWLNLIHPSDSKTYRTLIENQIKHGEAFYETEFRIKCKDDSFKWLHERGIVITDKTSGKPTKIVATRSDISERKKDEEKLRNSEYLYNTTINSIKDLIIVIDNSFKVLLINDSMRRFCSDKLEINNPIYGTLQESFSFLFEKSKDALNKLFCEGKELIVEEYFDIQKHGHHFEIQYSPVIQDDTIVRAVITLRDITEKKNIEKIVMKTIIDTEEKERKRFSEDLHDDLGAILSTIKIYINTLHNEDLALEKRDKMVNLTNDLINQAIQNAREIANNLSPSVIKRFGLNSAIQTFCEKIEIAHNIHIDLAYMPLSISINEDQTISIYRIITELINNTLKHAQATEIKLHISNTDRSITIDYADNGKGFDMKTNVTNNNTKGHGISNIIMRINSFNGNFTLHDPATRGFGISICLNP